MPVGRQFPETPPCGLGEPAFVIQNREMHRPSPQPTAASSSPHPHLRVRLGPLLRWFFVGFLLFAELFLASRVWAGWRPQALARVLAVQIFFAPRLMLISLGFALVATLVAERMVRWIARPMTRRWLTPTIGLPPETELPLYLRMGERIQFASPARHKTAQGWEPGWLVLSDQRLLWLSGIWRTIAWELAAADPADPLPARLEPGPVPRWLGGYVVGMPPRLVVHLSPTAYAEDGRQELVALAHPLEFIRRVEFMNAPDLQAQADHPPPPHDEPVLAPVKSLGQPLENTAHPLAARNVQLPPRRPQPPRPVPVRKVRAARTNPFGQNHPLAVRGVTLPPRRRNS